MNSKFIIKDVSKSFFQKEDNSHKEILKNINLEISSKEITIILGKSGCGKTTFLRILAGLEDVNSGSIKFVNTHGAEKIAKIGMVFQEPRLMPWLNVEENIKIHEEEHKIDVSNILSLVSLNDIKKLYPSELSGGMASRVAIGRAIAYDPDILLMDEPFASLDYFTRMQLQKEIIKIHNETKKGIVFVTHNIDEALLLGEKIIVFNDGVYSEFNINQSYPRDLNNSDIIFLKKQILGKILKI